MSLPIVKDDNRNVMSLQTQWATQLNPLLAAPISNSILLKNVNITPGLNVINHLLGRKLQGWFVASATTGTALYDGQISNQMTDKTLWLIAGNTCTINLVVF